MGQFAVKMGYWLPQNWETLIVTTIKLCRSLGSPCRARCLGFQIRTWPSCRPEQLELCVGVIA